MAIFREWAKRWREAENEGPTALHIRFLQLIQQFQVAARSTSPDMTTVFYAWLYRRFIEIQSNLRRKKLHRTIQSSSFHGGSFRDRGNLRAPVQIGIEMFNSKMIFSQEQTHSFSHHSTRVIRLIKQHELSFPRIEINKPLHAPVQSVSEIRFKFRGQN